MTGIAGATIFGTLSDGRIVTEYVLRNRQGMVARILDYGGIIRTLEVPDNSGKLDDVVLGFDSIDQYEGEHPYFGAIIGRVAGRIGGGNLCIDGVDYQLPINNAPNHLHGGTTGFDHRLWDADYSAATQSLTLTYQSPVGEEGYPGELISRVTYRLTDENELIVDYHGTTSASTAVNLTQHSYFNLSGDPSQVVLDHTLTVNSGHILELDDVLIPTGRILDVTDSRFDLRAPRRINKEDGDGFDHFWVLSESERNEPMKLASELVHEKSGRILQLLTTAPGVQIYTGNALPTGLIGKNQVEYGPMVGACFEAQGYPDSPNHPEFPDITLSRNAIYESTTVFRFLVR